MVNAVGKGIEHLGQEAGKELVREKKGQESASKSRWTSQGKTIECVVTLFNSC